MEPVVPGRGTPFIKIVEYYTRKSEFQKTLEVYKSPDYKGPVSMLNEEIRRATQAQFMKSVRQSMHIDLMV